ncbi:MAG: ribosome biogenesis GTPase Der [Oligoflexales bacterium]
MNIGKIALVGRANVGKSTLFNRLTRSNKSLVYDTPGVTRDRVYGEVHFNESVCATVIDTGGYEAAFHADIIKSSDNVVWKQTEAALLGSDVIVMLFDGCFGVHPDDHKIIKLVKKTDKPVIYCVNKAEHPKSKDNKFDFYALGIGEPLFISASHNQGLVDLCERAESILKEAGQKSTADFPVDALKIAIIGKPNTGKSSILNRLTNEERALVSDVAGTTRDSLDTLISYNKKPYVIIDTAGIRRKTKIKDTIESMSVQKSLDAINRADVIINVVSAEEMVTDQDAKLINLATERFKPVLLVVNKWDLVEGKETHTMKELEADIRDKLKDSQFIPILFISCLHNKRVQKILTHVESLIEESNKRASTSQVNDIVHRAIQEHTPAFNKKFNKRLKLFYSTQVSTNPPTFVIKCNMADDIQVSYKRYLTHRIREALGFNTVPIRLLFRGKEAPKKSGAASAQQEDHSLQV